MTTIVKPQLLAGGGSECNNGIAGRWLRSAFRSSRQAALNEGQAPNGGTKLGSTSKRRKACFLAGQTTLCMGAELPFLPEHVIDIGDPPAEYVEWQLGQEPERRWPRQ